MGVPMLPSPGNCIPESRDGTRSGRGEALERRLLSVDGLCAYLSMPKKTVYNYVALRRFPAGAVRRIGRKLLFEKAAIDAWVSEQPAA